MEYFLSHHFPVYDRFLKADPISGKFNLRMKDMASTHPSWISEKRHRKFGRCYTIHPDKTTRYYLFVQHGSVLKLPYICRNLGIYYMRIFLWVLNSIWCNNITCKLETFFSSQPTKLYFHRNNQFLDLSGRMGYHVNHHESSQHQGIS